MCDHGNIGRDTERNRGHERGSNHDAIHKITRGIPYENEISGRPVKLTTPLFATMQPDQYPLKYREWDQPRTYSSEACREFALFICLSQPPSSRRSKPLPTVVARLLGNQDQSSISVTPVTLQ